MTLLNSTFEEWLEKISYVRRHKPGLPYEYVIAMDRIAFDVDQMQCNHLFRFVSPETISKVKSRYPGLWNPADDNGNVSVRILIDHDSKTEQCFLDWKHPIQNHHPYYTVSIPFATPEIPQTYFALEVLSSIHQGFAQSQRFQQNYLVFIRYIVEGK